jgi:hypothetical protein
MTTLNEQRLVNAHQLGRKDYREGRELLVPTYLPPEEQEAYAAGYKGEQRRAQK